MGEAMFTLAALAAAERAPVEPGYFSASVGAGAAGGGGGSTAVAFFSTGMATQADKAMAADGMRIEIS